MVFAISATPKVYFHPFLARHNDVSFCKEANKAPTHLHRQGFNCHFDQLVVALPYIYQPASISVDAPALYSEKNAVYLQSYLHCVTTHTESRGPPQA